MKSPIGPQNSMRVVATRGQTRSTSASGGSKWLPMPGRNVGGQCARSMVPSSGKAVQALLGPQLGPMCWSAPMAAARPARPWRQPGTMITPPWMRLAIDGPPAPAAACRLRATTTLEGNATAERRRVEDDLLFKDGGGRKAKTRARTDGGSG